jgi:Copine/C2 domain
MQYGAAGGLNVPLTLYFKCYNLRKKDTYSKSDPYIKVETIIRSQRSEAGKTETIGNDLNPIFKKGISMLYFFELHQEIIITCMDDDADEDDLIGSATCSLAQVVSNPMGKFVTTMLYKGKPHGTVEISYEKVVLSKKVYDFQIHCEKVKDIEFFSKSDPYLVLYRPADHINSELDPKLIPESEWKQVHQTEWYKDNLNPVFAPFQLDGGTLCRNNPTLPLKFEIWDHSNRGEHEWISSGLSSVNRIRLGERSLDTKDKKGEFAGKIVIKNFKETTRFDLIDYIRNGLQLCLSIAIDLTGSNGDPKQPSSLHYISKTPNQYQRVINQVGQIMVNYDADRMIPAYGFGAVYKGQFQNKFAINGNEEKPHNKSWEGVLDAYSNIIKSVELYGPTNFSPVINQVIQHARDSSETHPMVYHVLLIITDGIITDMAASKAALVEASRLPISVIIVGVGNESFKDMNILDADNGQLKDNKGNLAVRDIVQFVKFTDYAASDYSLAEAVLRELPGQVDKYYNMVGIVPKI